MNIKSKQIIKDFSYALGNILGYSAEESIVLNDNLKRHVAYRMMAAVTAKFDQEQLATMNELERNIDTLDENDPRLVTLKNAIQTNFAKNDLEELARDIFIQVLEEYILFMDESMDDEQKRLTKQLLDDVQIASENA